MWNYVLLIFIYFLERATAFFPPDDVLVLST